jgi:RHS repeat-associated protein
MGSTVLSALALVCGLGATQLNASQREHGADAAVIVAGFHNDHLGTPWRITDKAGALVWSADYDGFGRASVSVPATNAVTNHLRYPGQYFDAETGLHYNDRRYYDPATGRYLTRDPLGFGGGTNLYAYAAHNPTNLIDPSGEILPCLAASYIRCMAACMLMSAAEDYFLECGNVDWGDNAKECAIDCLWSMLPIPNPCGKFGKYFGMGMGIAGAAGMNSFTAETLVQVMPAGAGDADATQGKTGLKPIGALQVGDKVLALAEWKDRGVQVNGDVKTDARLAYERITDIYTSRKEQVLVHLTLASGEQVTATEGHPFKTSEGWRDAVLLKRGGKLLLKGSAGDGSERTADIADVRVERSTVQVFNLEVANAHTYFVGNDGVLVHNGAPPPNFSPPGAGRRGAFREAKRKCNIPMCQQPSSVGPNLDRRVHRQAGRAYNFGNCQIREDAGGHDYGPGNNQNRGPHFNDPAGNHYDY